MANWSARDFLNGAVWLGRVVEVADGPTADSDYNRKLAEDKLIAPLEKTRRGSSESPIEAVPPERFLPPPSRSGQRPFVDSRPTPKQSQPCTTPAKATTGRRVRPPLPPRSLGQSDIRSQSADGTKSEPSQPPELPSLNLLTTRYNSCTPPVDLPLETQPGNSLHTVANLRSAPTNSAPTTPKSSCDGRLSCQRRSPTVTSYSSSVKVPAEVGMETEVRCGESPGEAMMEAETPFEEGFTDNGALGTPELLSFADKVKHLEGLLSKH